MRCKVCDYDIELSFISELPGEDYCKVCENIILETIREKKEEMFLKVIAAIEAAEREKSMCPECTERAKLDGLPWCDNEECPHWGGDNA